jgi:hypothetical protein
MVDVYQYKTAAHHRHFKVNPRPAFDHPTARPFCANLLAPLHPFLRCGNLFNLSKSTLKI